MPRYVDGFVTYRRIAQKAGVFSWIAMPFDHKRMVYGGFKTLVDA
jgi:uncharacterized protein YbaA (DUF1428 family)